MFFSTELKNITKAFINYVTLFIFVTKEPLRRHLLTMLRSIYVASFILTKFWLYNI